MGENESVASRKYICNHFKERRYTQKRLDILNGFELVLTRCINCHKVMNLETRRIKMTHANTNVDNKLMIRLLNLFKKIKYLIKKMINRLLFSSKNTYKQS